MNNSKASINTIESLGAVDGPGIRTVIFFNGCKLRCKYCHNPEMFNIKDKNYCESDLIKKIKRFKPYYGKNGGVTLSGGEPLLHKDFLINLCKSLKKENIHIALDTAGYGIGEYEKILENIDLIIFDVKDITEKRFKDLTGGSIEETWKFLEIAKKMKKKFWVRQVIVPSLHDNEKYIDALADYIKKHIDVDMIEKIEFLPYHKLGSEKYENLNIENPYKDKPSMDKNKCETLYNLFMQLLNKNN